MCYNLLYIEAFFEKSGKKKFFSLNKNGSKNICLFYAKPKTKHIFRIRSARRVYKLKINIWKTTFLNYKDKL
jgi:hypothetical protein